MQTARDPGDELPGQSALRRFQVVVGCIPSVHHDAKVYCNKSSESGIVMRRWRSPAAARAQSQKQPHAPLLSGTAHSRHQDSDRVLYSMTIRISSLVERRYSSHFARVRLDLDLHGHMLPLLSRPLLDHGLFVRITWKAGSMAHRDKTFFCHTRCCCSPSGQSYHKLTMRRPLGGNNTCAQLLE
jgi:hypothetical protein